jgi:hypothetical protein
MITLERVTKMMLTHASRQRILAYSYVPLLDARERHALPEGKPPRARGAGDLGPAKAVSPALFFSLLCRHASLDSAGKWRPVFVTLSRAPLAGQGDTRREPRPG